MTPEVSRTIYRRNSSRNMARFYVVALQADLLDGWAVVREWGRIGSPGRIKVEAAPSLAAAQTAAQALAVRKRGRGYR